LRTNFEVEKICDGSAFLGVDEKMGGNVDEDHQCDRPDAKVERIRRFFAGPGEEDDDRDDEGCCCAEKTQDESDCSTHLCPVSVAAVPGFVRECCEGESEEPEWTIASAEESEDGDRKMRRRLLASEIRRLH